MKKKLEIVYEDDHLVAVNKPAGLLTIPDRFKHDLPNLYDMLLRDRDEVFTLHRLDRNTSGGILFAKDAATHRSVSQLFMDHVPEKYYIAIVDGVPKEKTGIIEKSITESMSTRGKMLIHQRGKPSKSSYEVIQDFGRFAVVKVRIYTGRQHQVRVHLAHIGHPLMVDHLYGKREEFMLSEIKRKKFNLKKDEAERPLLSRHPLHAQSIKLVLPYNDQELDLEFDLPKDMNATIKQFNKILK